MKHDKISIHLVPASLDHDYIRHARKQTLLEVGEAVHEPLITPIPIAFYFLAYSHDRPVGMIEGAFHDQLYPSYSDSPYHGHVDLESLCPIERTAGVRTVYVEPSHRSQSLGLNPFILLYTALFQTFCTLGAEFATATTSSSAAQRSLQKLYTRLGGNCIGEIDTGASLRSNVVVFVFEKQSQIELPYFQRTFNHINTHIDLDFARRLRKQSLYTKQPELTKDPSDGAIVG